MAALRRSKNRARAHRKDKGPEALSRVDSIKRKKDSSKNCTDKFNIITLRYNSTFQKCESHFNRVRLFAAFSPHYDDLNLAAE